MHYLNMHIVDDASHSIRIGMSRTFANAKTAS